MIVRRTILTAILALALGLGATADAQAAYYVGGGKGIRVVFRVKGHKVIQADVVARLYCIGPHARRHFDRIKYDYASPEQPFRLDRLGGFQWDTTGLSQEEDFRLEDFLAGRVSGDMVKGRYEYFRAGGRRHTDCRTGSFPRLPGETAARFVARRQVRSS